MPKVTVETISKAMNGTIKTGNPNTVIKGIMSRYAGVKPGLLYFDVKGGKGGNDNIVKAIENGAIGVVISKYKKALPVVTQNLIVISVPSVGRAFWDAVKLYRDICDIPVVGVTGTSGKTTTKEMIASIFRLRWKTLKTRGNMNLPEFVPEHIMRLMWGYQAAVFEIGMNRPGHVSKQARIVRPKVGVITNIGLGHVQYFGTYENVVIEKSGIMEGIPDDGYLILNADDPGTKKINLSKFKGRIIYYGLTNKADYTASDIRQVNHGTFFNAKINNKKHQFFIPTFGRHNVYNALAAIAVANSFNFDVNTIKKGLVNYRRPSKRLQFVKGIRNSILINDTYNANPTSVIAGLEVLSSLSKGRTTVAVLGNMLEQGNFSTENHRVVGKKAAELNVDWLVTVGSLAKEIAKGASNNSKGIKIWSFNLKRNAINFLKKHLPNDSMVLVKGSRGFIIIEVS